MSYFWKKSTENAVFNYIVENVVVSIEKPQDATKRLNLKKTMGGDILIDDDIDFYIFILPLKKKIVTIPKKYGEKFCTEKQVSFYDYLAKNGIIIPNAVQAGELYGSFEVVYNDSAVEAGVLNVILNVIADFIDEENKYRSIDIDDIKKKLIRLVGRRNNETEPEEVLDNEKRIYGFGGASSRFGISSVASAVAPIYGMYYFE